MSNTEDSPQLSIKVLSDPRRKRATGRIRGTSIEVHLPQHWQKSFQKDMTTQLSAYLQKLFDRDYQLFQQSTEPRISIADKNALTRWVNQLNAETLQVPLNGVRIGRSKYTQLAQMNLKTHIMTVSKYCLRDIPQSAFRYLIIHELAHLKVPNHSKAFWDEVKHFVPDYKVQRCLIAAAHRVRVYEADLETFKPMERETKVIIPPSPTGRFKQLLFSLLPQSR
jgi:predicted metal-dependent hydrolase